MGWSCTALAGDVLDAVRAACIEDTGSSNRWRGKSHCYFFEVGRENLDGAITGTVWREAPGNLCYRSGSFRIEPSGRVSRGPALFRRAANALPNPEAAGWHRIESTRS